MMRILNINITGLILVLLILPFICSFCNTSRAYAMDVSAIAQASPPQITINWNGDGSTEYVIYKRLMVNPSGWSSSDFSTVWGDPIATLGSSARSYADTNVSVGINYEYLIKRGSLMTFISSGIEVPVKENRGKIILIIDDRFSASLLLETERLKQDLLGDGWAVITHYVSRTDTPPNVKSLIVSDYYSDPENVKCLFLLGNVPIPLSGCTAIDGHWENVGAHPADSYYADIDGVWTDSSVNMSTGGYYITSASDYRYNIPGDGKFDQTSIPSNLELTYGRVDFYDMPGILYYGGPSTFISEEEFMRRYLNKDHYYRHKQGAFSNLAKRNLSSDTYTSMTEGFSQLIGGASISCSRAEWTNTLGSSQYLGASTIGSTTGDIVHGDAKALFFCIGASWINNWNERDNKMRACLATPTYGLASWWGVDRPSWFLHQFAFNGTLGDSAHTTRNNNRLYQAVGYSPRGISITLNGDPSLSARPVAPVSSLVGIASGPNINLSWTPSVDPQVMGYNIYRSANREGPFTKLNANLITNAQYVDGSAGVNSYTYMVRAVKLEVAPTGSYYNASQGLFVTAGGANPTPVGTIVINSGAGSTDSTSVILSLWATDTDGVSQMRFSNDGYNWTSAESYATSKEWILTSGEGTKTVYVQYQDGAENWSDSFSSVIVLSTFDTVLPTGTININNGAVFTSSESVALALTATDDRYWVDNMRFSNDGVTWSTTEDYSTSKNWTLNAGDGEKKVYVQYKDKAGNWSTEEISDTIILDMTPPSFGTVHPTSGSALNKVDVTFTLSEILSACSIIFTATTSNNGETASSTHECILVGQELSNLSEQTAPIYNLVNGNSYDMKVLGTDRSGNSGQADRTNISYVDNLPPEIVSVNACKKNVEITFNEELDSVSALTQGSYSIDNGIIINNIVLRGNKKTVDLQTTDHATGAAYTLTVQNVKDMLNNPMSLTNVNYQADMDTIALWNFSGDGLDSSGNGYTLTLNGNTGYRETNVPSLGTAFRCTTIGSNATVSIPDTEIMPSAGRQISIEYWIYKINWNPRGLANVALLQIYQDYDSQINALYQGQWDYDAKVEGWLSEISAEVWTHVAVIYNGSQISYYQNGQLKQGPVNKSFNVGRTNGFSVVIGNFDGYIDNVRISNIARDYSHGAPLAPSGLTATAASTSEILLAWTDNANNEDGYKIERSPNGSTWTQITTVATNTATYNNTGLTGNTTYYYRVRAYNTAGDSAYSNTANTKTQNRPPVLSSIGNKTTDEGKTLNFTIVGSDPDSDPLTYTMTGTPSGASLNASSGAFNWTPSYSQAGIYTVTFEVRDSSLGTSETVILTVNNVLRTFVITASAETGGSISPIGNINVTEGNNQTFTITAEVGYSISNVLIDGTGQGGISAYTFSNVTTTHTIEALFSIALLSAPSGVTAAAVSVSRIDLSWTDNANNEEGYRIQRSPNGTSFWTTIATVGAVTSYNNTGLSAHTAYYYRVYAYNASGISAYSNTANAMTLNTNPSLISIGNKTTVEAQTLSFTVNAVDADGDSITYEAVTLPSGASFNTTSGLFLWSPNYTQANTYNVTFKARDLYGGISQETVVITVTNINRAPTLTPIGSKSVNENSALTFTVSGTDEDGTALTYSAANLPTGASFNTGTRVFSWT
ncbi:MAG: putative Ig domain-containing protein, partial [Candidatus Margulisiibacteriota bacterium]